MLIGSNVQELDVTGWKIKGADLEHLLPVEADEVFVKLSGAALALGRFMASQQPRQVNITVLQHHVDQSLPLDHLHMPHISILHHSEQNHS